VVPDSHQRVVILYSHPLLGEGIGRLLTADPDLEVELVRVDDLGGAERALSCSPDVVILERSAPIQAIDLLRFAPAALFIDVGLDAGPSWTYRREELSPQPEELLRAIHGRNGQAEDAAAESGRTAPAGKSSKAALGSARA
jgi:hypothetical protein